MSPKVYAQVVIEEFLTDPSTGRYSIPVNVDSIAEQMGISSSVEPHERDTTITKRAMHRSEVVARRVARHILASSASAPGYVAMSEEEQRDWCSVFARNLLAPRGYVIRRYAEGDDPRSIAFILGVNEMDVYRQIVDDSTDKKLAEKCECQ